MKAGAKARSNIALVKYWGKSDPVLNTPAVGSISITLDTLWTETTVEFSAELGADRFVLDGRERADQLGRVSACLDLLRAKAHVDLRAEVRSANNFPTGAGLASSASGFAALVAAAARALELALGSRELSILARRGSGSAARSIYGGFVEMHAGTRPDGEDSFAEPLLAAADWPLEVIVAVTERAEKPVGSGSGMNRSARSSPYYEAWVDSHPADLETARRAIAGRDFDALATVAEHSCLKMHAAAMSTKPPLVYWNGATLECMRRVGELRSGGLPVFYTVDAGPQVKAVCAPAASSRVREALRELPGVVEVLVTGLGAGVELLDAAAAGR